MNVKNKEGICVIDGTSSDTIENILNECIIDSSLPIGGKHEIDRTKDSYALKMDFSIFSHKENESEFVRSLNNSESHNHLLNHPLVATFLHIKWQKVKYTWYLYMLSTVMFYFLIFLYMFCFRKNLIVKDIINQETNVLTMKLVITILGTILMIREIIQFNNLKIDYLKSFDNYLDWAILILTCIMLCTPDK